VSAWDNNGMHNGKECLANELSGGCSVREML